MVRSKKVITSTNGIYLLVLKFSRVHLNYSVFIAPPEKMSQIIYFFVNAYTMSQLNLLSYNIIF